MQWLTMQNWSVETPQEISEFNHTDIKLIYQATGSSSMAVDAQTTLAAIPNIKTSVEMAEALINKHDYRPAVERLGEAIEFCPWDVHLRELRAQCHEAMGMLQSAISDIKMMSRLVHDNTDAFHRMSLLYYHMGEAEDSLREIRECLRLDPDHKVCFPFYKVMCFVCMQHF
jgi:DnaJ family protein C protein 3